MTKFGLGIWNRGTRGYKLGEDSKKNHLEIQCLPHMGQLHLLCLTPPSLTHSWDLGQKSNPHSRLFLRPRKNITSRQKSSMRKSCGNGWRRFGRNGCQKGTW